MIGNRTRSIKPNKKQLMDANRFNRGLVEMRCQIEQMQHERDYDEFVRKTNERIAQINKIIRSVNK